MNATEQLVLEELRAMKEFLFAMGLSNPVWVLPVPLVCGLFASQILWAVYVLWLERPIVVNRRHMKEDDEEAEVRGGAGETKREDAKGGEPGTLRTKEREELKEDRKHESDNEQKVLPTPLRYEVQPSVVVVSNFPLPLTDAHSSYLNSSVSEPMEQRKCEQNRVSFATANNKKEQKIEKV
ncbi:hypothetical protein ECG_02194 [Echinococcus granulosus]|uniref:Uncharacterized protein n=1 Tax=Echinococcus granulosus TaxID=6210 RepID=U6JCD6_ECHGR|nr:hypothetical protein EGR_04172 [Echinococcus granulosus]EUB60926.1 hypothetical protein EGR_04172 [Echinococcus granulosus]KAH9284818.1 hypothetical protein ECG_02194 [Echinococcus granulosus]CDS21760.1 hypothetical protein EgrG_000126300 [Echinococcus granulosus]